MGTWFRGPIGRRRFCENPALSAMRADITKKTPGPVKDPACIPMSSGYMVLVPVNLKRWTTESGLSASFATPVPVI